MPQRLSDVELASLIPETLTWDNGRPIDPLTWIRLVGSFEHAIAYGEVFWPDFAEHDGCILLAGFSEESYREFLRRTGGDKRAVEAVMNHRHITDLIYRPGDPPPGYSPGSKVPEQQVRYLGRLLKEMWQAKLAREFPGRAMVVHFEEEEGDSTEDFVITFHQDRGSGPVLGVTDEL